MLELPSEFDGSHTFNDCDLSSSCVGDDAYGVDDDAHGNLGANCSQEGGPNVDMTRRITRSMARQGQVQLGALMHKEELNDEDSQVFNVFQIQELDL